MNDVVWECEGGDLDVEGFYLQDDGSYWDGGERIYSTGFWNAKDTRSGILCISVYPRDANARGWKLVDRSTPGLMEVFHVSRKGKEYHSAKEHHAFYIHVELRQFQCSTDLS